MELARSDQAQILDTVSNSGTSQTSYAPSLFRAQDSISIPNPLRECTDAVPFECPHCYLVIAIRNTKEWAHHVFRDLMPYVCLFSVCPTPSKLYKSRRLWYDHICQAHLATNSTQNGFYRPICAIEIKPPLSFQRHVGRHLDELALFVLPRVDSEDVPDASSRAGSMLAMNDDGSSPASLIHGAEFTFEVGWLTRLTRPKRFDDTRADRNFIYTCVALDNRMIADLNSGVSKLGFLGSHTDNYSFLTETPDRVNPQRSNPEEDCNHLSEASYEYMKRSDLPKNGDSFPYTSPREQPENDSKDPQEYDKDTFTGTPKRRNFNRKRETGVFFPEVDDRDEGSLHPQEENMRNNDSRQEDNMPAATSQITSKDPNAARKGILEPPRYRFVEEPNPVGQGLPSSTNTKNNFTRRTLHEYRSATC
ncbi:hypothetical protein BDV33DRAFT_203722 [Aspergillus novoparasiticus]|uniref:Oxidoreductase acuF-like C2H2 type zinc-finger domain-containing protein n=1 Tax=Aspergillus novoparasiticus TaxID=986946 RepID=A0A5N6ERX2_9EURO|nr:hypothetical protein BDV33DRAFT_203722 [Aspergillus novoparasiticus]